MIQLCYKKSILVLGITVLVGIFQACSGVDFSSKLDGSSEASEGGFSGPGLPSNDDGGQAGDMDLGDEVNKNPACRGLNEYRPAAVAFKEDYILNGSHDSAVIKDKAEVIVNGITNRLAVWGVDSVNINGRHRDICILSPDIRGLNGALGNGGNVSLYSGLSEGRGRLGNINGTSSTNLVISGFDLDVINGSYNYIFLIDSSVRLVNISQSTQIILMDGSSIERVSGNTSVIQR